MSMYKYDNHVERQLICDKILGDTEIPDKILTEIKSLLNIEPVLEHNLHKKLTSLNINKRYIKDIVDNIFKYPESKNLIKYINNELNLEYFKGNDIVNIIDILNSKYNINKDLLKWLLKYKWSATPALGAGEVFLTILIKDVLMSNNLSGDLLYKENTIEVKSNNCRIKFQNDATPTTLRNTFIKMFTKLGKKYNPDVVSVIKNASNTFWNFTGNNWGCEKLGILLKDSNVVSLKSIIANITTEGLLKMYINAKYGDIYDCIYNNINDDMTWDHKKVIRDLAIFSFKYYADNTNFKTMCLLDNSGNILVFDTNRFEYFLDTNKIKAYAPSFSKNCGNMGSGFMIKLNI